MNTMNNPKTNYNNHRLLRMKDAEKVNYFTFYLIFYLKDKKLLIYYLILA